jgi:EAL domain-containing protein (putative c-di-GMP-specific phosphodiesterase class I)
MSIDPVDLPIDSLARPSGVPGVDPLTGLPDAEAFQAVVAERMGQEDAPTGIGLIELHGLSRFNDFEGQAAGDRLLCDLARKFARLARDEFGPSAVVARVSGARFGLVPPARTAVERLRVEMRGLAGAIGDSLSGTAGDLLGLRIAVGTLPGAGNPAEAVSLIARRLAAPPALVRAIDVESAVAGIGIKVLFQPQFAMADDRLIGAEALVRWHHPRLGEIGGALLFTAAAAAGLERKLSRTVWEQALASIAAWPAPMAGLRIALNLTAADLADPGLAEELLAMAAQAHVAPERLTVEVTESAVIERLDVAAASLARLRAGGMHSALDDFGTGYSSLAWLRQLPVDYIKIDSGFARDAAGGVHEQTVLRGVIDIARALGLDVLAEGVETEGQRAAFSAMGCRWYQGYLRSPALPDDAFVAYALA